MSAFRFLAAAAVVLLPACAPREPAPLESASASTTAAGSDVLASVKATTFGADSVVFSLQVTNTTGAPLALNFTSGQTFDFAVLRGAQEVWRWSGDRMFTQSLRTITLDPGETTSYAATWTPVPGASGEYSVRGWLTARNVRAEQTTGFRL
jgi:hypothetical protein